MESEPKVHVYDFQRDRWESSMDLDPRNFVSINPQAKPVTYSQFSQLREEEIKAHFPFDGLGRSFYILRHDEILEEEQDHLTLYKVRIVEK